eukprot:EG_transcript_39924
MRGGHRFQSRSLSVLSSTPICRCTVPAPACPHLLLTGCLFLRRTKRQVMAQLPAKHRQLVPLALAAAAPDTEVPGSEDAGTDTDDGETASNLGSGGARKQRQYRLTGQAKALPTAHW